MLPACRLLCCLAACTLTETAGTLAPTSLRRCGRDQVIQQVGLVERSRSSNLLATVVRDCGGRATHTNLPGTR